jgi:hypothetical protein
MKDGEDTAILRTKYSEYSDWSRGRKFQIAQKTMRLVSKDAEFNFQLIGTGLETIG